MFATTLGKGIWWTLLKIKVHKASFGLVLWGKYTHRARTGCVLGAYTGRGLPRRSFTPGAE